MVMMPKPVVLHPALDALAPVLEKKRKGDELIGERIEHPKRSKTGDLFSMYTGQNTPMRKDIDDSITIKEAFSGIHDDENQIICMYEIEIKHQEIDTSEPKSHSFAYNTGIDPEEIERNLFIREKPTVGKQEEKYEPPVTTVAEEDFVSQACHRYVMPMNTVHLSDVENSQILSELWN